MPSQDVVAARQCLTWVKLGTIFSGAIPIPTAAKNVLHEVEAGKGKRQTFYKTLFDLFISDNIMQPDKFGMLWYSMTAGNFSPYSIY